MDIEGINYMWKEIFSWSKQQLQNFGKPYGKLKEIADPKFSRSLNKPELVSVCSRSFEYVSYLMETVESYQNVCTTLQAKLIQNQERLINVQKELSECQSEKLDSMKKIVETSVADSVKGELMSYSSVVANSQPAAAPVISPEALKTVVKTVVAEEDRSRNLLVFGLPDEEGEELEARISEVLEEVGQKPKVEVQRLGKKKTSTTTRPVKVRLSSSLIVHKILANARKLRLSAKFKTVFLSPDRTFEQREVRKELITNMKAKAIAEPDKKFYIKEGQIFSSNRNG
ncbi:hypothetical protein ACHWQZ_G013964 [Mnemiopsis leidyi]